MRISVDRADPGYRPRILSGFPRENYDVFLDGTPLEFVVTADDEEGIVLVHEKDETGVFRHVGGVLMRRELRGVVQIIRS